MVDTARHFLSVESLKRVLESLPLSKLNILHWHMVDDESFPIELISHPELAQYGSYSSEETYSIDQIKDLIKVAKANAVKIIPEIDSPAHVRSWGLAPQWSKSTIKCPGGEGYNGQLDVSNDDVLALSKQVVKEVNGLFLDSPYIHLGGDEVSSRCWDQRPEIQAWMRKQGIQDYGELQMYWRDQLKSTMFPERRVVFWRNNAQKVKIDENDILHFWGSQSEVAKGNPSTIQSPPALKPKSSFHPPTCSTSTRARVTSGRTRAKASTQYGRKFTSTSRSSLRA